MAGGDRGGDLYLVVAGAVGAGDAGDNVVNIDGQDVGEEFLLGKERGGAGVRLGTAGRMCPGPRRASAPCPRCARGRPPLSPACAQAEVVRSILYLDPTGARRTSAAPTDKPPGPRRADQGVHPSAAPRCGGAPSVQRSRASSSRWTSSASSRSPGSAACTFSTPC
ncbi:MAG: hypothetical protein ACK559_21720, partial [bacterium]